MLSTVAIALALAVASSGPAIPELSDAAAREHVRRGMEHFDRGELEEAAAELAAAYAIERDTTLLAARAKVEHARGDCAQAVALFREYLDTEPPDAAAAAARGYIEDCGGDRVVPDPAARTDEDPARPPPGPAAGITPPRDEPVDRPRPKAPPPWWTDPAGGALVGAGAVLLATGIGLVAGAYVMRDAAESESHDRYVAGIGRAMTLERASIPLMSVGGALLLGGAVRYGLVARKRRDGAAKR